MKISFIGSGSVALNTAFVCGLSGLFEEIIMLDLMEDFARGRSIDLEQGCILNKNNVNVVGTSDYNYVKDSDIIVITAGVSNKTNGGSLNRESLLAKNIEIITSIANKLNSIIQHGEKQPLIIMVTNPLDLILKHFIDIGNFNKQKTIGSGNWLDSARFIYYLSKEFGVKKSDIETFVVGQHGQKMVYLLSQTKISGMKFLDFVKKNNISQERIDDICAKSTNGAYEIINLVKTDGTTFGPAVSIFNIIESYIKNLKNTIPVSFYCNGEYGINNYCIGCPAVIGNNGVEEIKIFDISEAEKENIKKSFEFMNNLSQK